MRVAILAFAMSTALLAQNAKVIELTPAEATEAKSIAQEQKDLAQREIDLRYDIALHHNIARELPTRASACIGKGCIPSGLPEADHRWVEFVVGGWLNGFEYSEDYRFIVPKAAPASNYIQSPCGAWGTTTLANCLTINPAWATGDISGGTGVQYAR